MTAQTSADRRFPSFTRWGDWQFGPAAAASGLAGSFQLEQLILVARF
jgi:hypothetical protein